MQEATPSSIALGGLPRLALGLWVLTVGTTSCYNDSDFQLDQESGATSSRGGTPTSTGGSATQAGTKSEGGAGGDGPSAPSYPPPKIASMDPTSGPYGTLVTIAGEGLGNPSMAGVTLALGAQGEVELTPDDKQAVVSWTDEEIVIRFPFPAEGAVAIQTPAGMALAGDFAPTYMACDP